MYEVKFDTLKKKALDILGWKFKNTPFNEDMVIYAIVAGARESSGVMWRKNYDELWEKCREIVEGWDVRMVKKLIECFPGIVPQKCDGKKITCYMADNKNSDWMVAFE